MSYQVNLPIHNIYQVRVQPVLLSVWVTDNPDLISLTDKYGRRQRTGNKTLQGTSRRICRFGRCLFWQGQYQPVPIVLVGFFLLHGVICS